jgi:heme exporter protein C
MKKLAFPLAAAVAAAGLCLALWAIFYRAPIQVSPVVAQSLFFNQKIFYWHVPHAMLLFVAVFVCGIASAGYLKHRRGSWDDVAMAAGELSVLLGAIVLITGSIWGRAAWNVWWQWELRLTTSLLLWLIMVGYVIVRRFGGPGSERLAAGLAVFGMIDVPLIYFSVKIQEALHPPPNVIPSLDPAMKGAFWGSFAAIAIVYGLLLVARAKVARTERELGEVRDRALDAGVLEE